ncbi:BTAD domain-containing putative transcriptional regulator [Gemmatimonadota bacterium]
MVKLLLFGSVDIRGITERELDPLARQPRRVALLAYLATASPHGFHRRDKLVTLFWPESNTEKARHSLAQALHVLRQFLGDEVIVTRGTEEVAVNSELLCCDVVAFERAFETGDLDAALELYRGHFLDGFHVSGAEVFERWVEDERVRLSERAAGVAWAKAHEHIEAGHLVDAERTAQRAALLVPTDESEVRRFIKALADAGDRAAAVRFYEKVAQRLQEEYEISPADETVALGTLIRQGEAAPLGSSLTEGFGETAEAPPSATVGRKVPPDLLGAGQSAPAEQTSLARAIQRRPMMLGGALVVSAIALLALLSTFVGGKHGAGSSGGADEVASRRMVVIPLENRTGDSDAADWGLMAAEFVTQAIDRVGSVIVVPASIVRDHLRDMDHVVGLPIVEIARRTQARYAVAGSYSISNGQVRFAVELVDAESGDMLRALDPVSGPADSLESVVGTVAQRVTAAAVALLDPRAPFALRELPPSLEVFRGHMAMNDAFCQGRWQDAIELARPALRAAPDYAPTLYLVGAAYGNLGRRHEEDSVAALIEAHLDRLPTYTRLQFQWLRGLRWGDLDEATRASEQLYQLHPRTFGLHAGLTAHSLNRLEAALERLRAQDINTWCFRNWVGWWVETAEVYHQLGRFDEELALARRGLERFPNRREILDAELRALVGLGRIRAVDSLIDRIGDLPVQEGYQLSIQLIRTALELKVHGYRGRFQQTMDRALTWLASQPATEMRDKLGRGFFYAERWIDADTLLATLIDEVPGDVELRGMRAVALAHSGRREEATAIEQWLEELDRADLSGAHTRWRAAIAAALGYRDRAVRLLQQAIREGVAHGIWQHRDPEWEPLRDYPPFQELMRPKR